MAKSTSVLNPLYDGRIPQCGPFAIGNLSGTHPTSEILQGLPHQVLNYSDSGYSVVAAAARYVVDIKKPRQEFVKFDIEYGRKILFHGGIMIFGEGKEERAAGHYSRLLLSGRIWMTTPDDDGFREEKGLQKLVFGGVGMRRTSFKSRVEKLLDVYEKQRQEARQQEHRATMDMIDSNVEAAQRGRRW